MDTPTRTGEVAGTMDLPLVVGTDGSDCSLDAIDWAVDEAARHSVALRVVHGSLWEYYEGVTPSLTVTRSPQEVMAEHIVASAAERARKRQPDVPVTTAVVPDDPTQVLVAESDGAFAIVVGQRGRGEIAALLLGSVSLATAANARCPVFVVRGGNQQRQGHYRWITVAVADNGRSDAAVDFAFREAVARGWGIEAVHAWRWSRQAAPDAGAGDTAKERLRHAEELLDEALRGPMAEHPDVQVRRAAVEGSARKVLLESSDASDLLVVGARRRDAVVGLQLGLVNHAMLHHAPCPVAVVPQQA